MILRHGDFLWIRVEVPSIETASPTSLFGLSGLRRGAVIRMDRSVCRGDGSTKEKGPDAD